MVVVVEGAALPPPPPVDDDEGGDTSPAGLACSIHSIVMGQTMDSESRHNLQISDQKRVQIQVKCG